MSTSRASFLKALTKIGFTEKPNETTMSKYFPREFFHKEDRVVSLSSKGTEVEVSVYHTKAKTIARFENYRDALQYINKEEERIKERFARMVSLVESNNEGVLSLIKLIASYPCSSAETIERESNQIKMLWSNPEKKAKLHILLDETGQFKQELKVRKTIYSSQNNQEELLLQLNRYFS